MSQALKHVDNKGIVRTVGNWAIVHEGEVKHILRAAVVQNGVVREFWPNIDVPDPNPGDPNESNLILDSQSIFIFAEANSPTDAIGFSTFNRTDGLMYYGDDAAEPVTIPTVPVFAPSPDAAGQFLYRITVNTFDPGLTVQANPNTPTVIGAWTDVYNAFNQFLGIEFINADDTPNTRSANVTWEFAADDGGGSPIAGTERALSINAAIGVNDADGNSVIMSTEPWSLTDITVDGTNALVSLRVAIPFGNDLRGQVLGYENTVQGNPVLQDYYSESFPQGWDIKIEKSSGDDPTAGDGLFDWRPLDQNFYWDWQTTTEEQLTALVSLSIRDAGGIVRTKPVNVRAERKAPAVPDPGVDVVLDTSSLHLNSIAMWEPPESQMEEAFIGVTVRNNGWVYFSYGDASADPVAVTEEKIITRKWASTANADSNDFTPIANAERFQARVWRKNLPPPSNDGEVTSVTNWQVLNFASVSWFRRMVRDECKFKSETTYTASDQAWVLDIVQIGDSIPGGNGKRLPFTWLLQMTDVDAPNSCPSDDNPVDPNDPPPSEPPATPGDPSWPPSIEQ